MEIRDQIRSILKEKGAEVRSVHPSVSVYDAIAAMSEKQVGALLVIEGQDWSVSSLSAIMLAK